QKVFSRSLLLIIYCYMIIRILKFYRVKTNYFTVSYNSQKFQWTYGTGFGNFFPIGDNFAQMPYLIKTPFIFCLPIEQSTSLPVYSNGKCFGKYRSSFFLS